MVMTGSRSESLSWISVSEQLIKNIFMLIIIEKLYNLNKRFDMTFMCFVCVSTIFIINSILIV